MLFFWSLPFGPEAGSPKLEQHLYIIHSLPFLPSCLPIHCGTMSGRRGMGKVQTAKGMSTQEILIIFLEISIH